MQIHCGDRQRDVYNAFPWLTSFGTDSVGGLYDSSNQLVGTYVYYDPDDVRIQQLAANVSYALKHQGQETLNIAVQIYASEIGGWALGKVVGPLLGRIFANTSEAVEDTATGEIAVYQSVNADGEVQYVGVTNNLERRAAEHMADKGIQIQEIRGLKNLSREDARAVEQVLIEKHGLAKNGGTLLNKINSMSKTNPTYAAALQRGTELLKKAKYPGF